MPTLRVTFDYDPDPDFSYLDQWDTPETYVGNEIRKDDGSLATFEEYMAYWGNVDRHVAIVADVEAQCECCGSWVHQNSLGGIDFMDDDDDWTTGTFSQDDIVTGKVKGYLAEVATTLFAEATEI